MRRVAQRTATRSPRRLAAIRPGARSAGATGSSRTASRSSCRATRSRSSRTCRASPRCGRTSATTPRASTRRARSRSAPTSSGARTLETAGNGMKIGIIDDGVDATHPYFNPSGLPVPARLPEGPDAVHDAEGDRAAHVRAGLADLQVRERAVRPDDVVPRDARRGHRRRRPRHAGRRHASSPASRRTRTSGTTRRSRSRRPSFGLDGNSAEIAAAIEAAVADGMDVINLSLGEPEVEPKRDIVVTAIEGAARRGRRAGRRGRQRLRRLRLRLGQLARQRAERDHRRRGRLAQRDRGLLLGRADAGLAADEAGRRLHPAWPSLSSLPESQGGRGARSSGTSMAARTSPAAPRCSKQRHPTLDGRADQVGARADRRPGARRERPGGVDARARAAASINLPRARRPAGLRGADGALVRRARGRCERDAQRRADRRGRRRGRLDGDDRAAAGRRVT